MKTLISLVLFVVLWQGQVYSSTFRIVAEEEPEVQLLSVDGSWIPVDGEAACSEVYKKAVMELGMKQSAAVREKKGFFHKTGPHMSWFSNGVSVLRNTVEIIENFVDWSQP